VKRILQAYKYRRELCIDNISDIRLRYLRFPHGNHICPCAVADLLPVLSIQPTRRSSYGIQAGKYGQTVRSGTYVCIRVREIYAPESVAARRPYRMLSAPFEAGQARSWTGALHLRYYWRQRHRNEETTRGKPCNKGQFRIARKVGVVHPRVNYTEHSQR
jgi:hypothetical protein